MFGKDFIELKKKLSKNIKNIDIYFEKTNIKDIMINYPQYWFSRIDEKGNVENTNKNLFNVIKKWKSV